MWLSSDVQEQQQWIKIAIKKKLKAVYFPWGCLLSFGCNPFVLSLSQNGSAIITVTVVLYGCETWSLTLRREHRLRRTVWERDAAENFLRRIFGPGSNSNRRWRRVHNEELHNLYFLPNIIIVIKSRRMRGAGHVACVSNELQPFNLHIYIITTL
jgi:hypothetical protein